MSDLSDSGNISDRQFLNSQRWTKQEDDRLKTAVEQVGERWDLVGKLLKTRTEVQCQQRWTKVVNPNLIKGPWTREVNYHALFVLFKSKITCEHLPVLIEVPPTNYICSRILFHNFLRVLLLLLDQIIMLRSHLIVFFRLHRINRRTTR